MSDASQPRPTLELFAGGTYRRRDGGITPPLEVNRGLDPNHGPPDLYPWIVPRSRHCCPGYSVGADGREDREYFEDDSDNDLIEAVTVTNTPRPGETPEQTAARNREPSGSVAAVEDPAAQLARLAEQAGPAADGAIPAALRDDIAAQALAVDLTLADLAPAGYASLACVLDEALRQASDGKGRQRHARGATPFDRQPILEIGRMLGPGFELGQSMKKTQEAAGMLGRGEPDRAVTELLGAINYLAAAVILVREGSR